MTFTSQLIVERSAKGSRASVKEQGKGTCRPARAGGPLLPRARDSLRPPGQHCARARAPLRSGPSLRVAAAPAEPWRLGRGFQPAPLGCSCGLCPQVLTRNLKTRDFFFFIIQVSCKNFWAFIREADVPQMGQGRCTRTPQAEARTAACGSDLGPCGVEVLCRHQLRCRDTGSACSAGTPCCPQPGGAFGCDRVASRSSAASRLPSQPRSSGASSGSASVSASVSVPWPHSTV